MTALPQCGIDGCPNPVRVVRGHLGKYCSPRHASTAERERKRDRMRRLRGELASLGGNRRADSANDGQSQTRQQPLRPTSTGTVDPRIVIRPPRPAPVKLYQDGPDAGQPMLFQDDLNAIFDHGSPGRLRP